MKRLVVLVAACVVAAGIAAARDPVVLNLQISLKQPVGGERLDAGTKYDIVWSVPRPAPGAAAPAFRLLLLKGNSQVGIIADQVAYAAPRFPAFLGQPPAFVDQRYSWVVGQHKGGTATGGDDYKVRIEHADGSDGSTSGMFGIVVVTDSPGGQVMVKPGDCVISSFTALPLPSDPGRLGVKAVVKNVRSTPISGLQLRIVKAHVEVGVWTLPQMAPGTTQERIFTDTLPAPFQTFSYEAILSMGPASAPGAILDRKPASYRRAGTVRGSP